MRTRPGLALIIVVGVLGLMAALATAFTTLAQLERRASRQRLNVTKAGLLARSGIEDAMARLGAGQDPDAPDARYRGEDWDASTMLDGRELAAEVYRSGNLDMDGCPARQALRPSFYVRNPGSVGADGLEAPRLREAGGRERGFSGALSGGQWGNQYALKVTPQAGIWLNGGNPALGPAVGYNAVLRRILGNLAEAVDREPAPITGVPGADDGSPADLVDGENLINLRPQPGGWTGWEQVRDVALGGSQVRLDALRSYLTLRAWVDTRTLKPDAGSVTQTADMQTWSQIRLGVDDLGNPTRGLPTLEPRAPVNLAWARSRWPMLVALMGGLKGLCLNEGFRGGDSIGRMISAELVLDWTATSDPCRGVASELAGYSGPLSMNTWDDWNAFCDALPSALLGAGTEPGAAPAIRSLLKANFNPNSRLNKFNPNQAMWHMVDKQDLLPDGYTTEFVLEPTHSHGVESVGRILGRDGRLLASRVLRCEISGPKVARLSTQREFVCQGLGNLDKAGDETGVRIPGVDSPFLPPSQGNGIKTWGQDLPGLSVGGVKKGVGIQPYPEPYVDLDPASATWNLALSLADYDGSLQLATLETDAGYTYTANAAPNDMKMLARWTADLDLAVSDADPARSGTTAAAKWRNQNDSNQAPLANGLLHPSLPNTLHPDGCYSERDRAPGYFDKDNANGIRGLMSFWMKPNHGAGNVVTPDPSAGATWEWDNNTGDYGWCVFDPINGFWTTAPGWNGVSWDPPYRNCQLVKWTNFFTGPGGGAGNPLGPDQLFSLVHCSKTFGFAANTPRFTGAFEICHNPSGFSEDSIREHHFQSGEHATRPHRWRLLTFAWNLQALDKNDTGELVVDDGTGIGELVSTDAYGGGNVPTDATDLTDNDRFGDYPANGAIGVDGVSWPHLIFLGRRGFLQDLGWADGNFFGRGADTTFDEFAMYDFGSGVGTVGGPAATLAGARFTEGRYYKESAYPATLGLLVPSGAPNRTAAEYFSAPIDLGGARLRALSWTQVVPRGLKAPLPAPPAKPGIDGDDGEDGRIEMELTDLLGTSYAPDASGNAMNTTFRNSASSQVDRTPLGPFRLHAVFRPNLNDKGNTPILDPLTLDDVTLLYDPPGGSRISGWRGGEGP